MVRGELGKRPLLCDAIRRSVLYIKQVVLYTGTLAYHALGQELFLNDESNIFYLARMYTPHFNETNYYRSPKDKKEVKHITNECYDKVWQTGRKLMSKADAFLSFKKNISLGKYTWIIKNRQRRVALSRLRLSSHPLMIEKGRHCKPRFERLDRKCPYCNDTIGDECHFVISCPLYNNERRELLTEAMHNSLLFNEIPTDQQKFVFILPNEDTSLITKLAAFVQIAFKARSSYLEKPWNKVGAVGFKC